MSTVELVSVGCSKQSAGGAKQETCGISLMLVEINLSEHA